MSIRMQQRRGTSEQWTLSDPVLAEAEIGFETDTNKFKVGNGVTHWINLSYFLSETGLSTSLEDYVAITQLAAANGVATLDATGNVPFSQLGNIVDGAPGVLDTLNELAAAIGDDASFITTMNTSIATKAEAVHTHVKTDITDFTHTHIKTDITDFAHTHTISQITDYVAPVIPEVTFSNTFMLMGA